jgi:hypothetical protein
MSAERFSQLNAGRHPLRPESYRCLLLVQINGLSHEQLKHQEDPPAKLEARPQLPTIMPRTVSEAPRPHEEIGWSATQSRGRGGFDTVR